ncbi:hypothetical protein PRZ48_012584 [Zasmidium cellare]|uniref:Uncharacterized protein n=1 Tax=Zasmidium cellare TaxID=395010 RepID=A0ABR0E5J8_ZASCE|nr:hypothetical protein PRZ48_012584 [Zasmidium cellare]
MVHYRSEKGNKPDDHWKLEGEYRHGLRYWSREEVDREHDLLTRMRRGFLDYQRCTMKELREFVFQRKLLKTAAGYLKSLKLEQSSETEPVKARLVDLLEKADDDQAFDRFLILPAELRAHIYDIHFSWLLEKNDGSLTSPTPPPITEVCSIVRKETLEPFFQTCFLNLGFEDTYEYKMIKSESRFFLNAPPSQVAMVRKINLYCELVAEASCFPITIEIDPGTSTVQAKTKPLNTDSFDLAEATTIETFGEELNEWIQGIRGRSEVVELRASDIRALFNRVKAMNEWSIRQHDED